MVTLLDLLLGQLEGALVLVMVLVLVSVLVVQALNLLHLNHHHQELVLLVVQVVTNHIQAMLDSLVMLDSLPVEPLSVHQALL